MSRKHVWWIASLAAVAFLATLAFELQRRPEAAHDAWATAPAELQAVVWPVWRPVGPFHMRTQRGVAFGTEQFRGQWNFVFFGYLSCPDVCPTTLRTLADFRRRLLASDPAAGGYQFVFVSVDPANDNAEQMAAYLAYFDRDFLGLTGEAGELANLASSMGAAYAERVDEHGMHSIDHSTSVMLVDPAGRVVGGLPAPHDPARMLNSFEDLRRHLGS
jgi:protein SCO1/2